MPACPAFDPLGPYGTGLTRFVDCHVRALGEGGYRALGAGSPVGLALTGLLTIYVALIGYRMLLGDVPSLREIVVSAVKIGFVLTLAMQWSAYQTLVYDVVIDGPGEIAARIFDPGGLGGDTRVLTDHVQGTYTAIEQAARPVPAPTADPTGPAGPPVGQRGQVQPQDTVAKPAAPVDPTLGLAAKILLIASLAGLLSVRIVAGLLLALGPLFIACFLFNAMRGLLEGWVRGLAGAAIGAIGVASVLAAELAILEPQVTVLLRARDAQEDVALLPGEILATTGLFALVLLAVVLATAKAAAGFRLPEVVRRETARLFDRRDRRERDAGAPPVPVMSANNDRPRARGVADAVAAIERREKRTQPPPVAPDRRAAALGETITETARLAPPPVGQRHRRGTARRRSASAARRDMTG